MEGGKNLFRTSQHMKIGEHKKKDGEWIAVACTFQKVDY
jgi:hypothetical protein